MEYSINPLSFTKLDANGNDLPDSATSWRGGIILCKYDPDTGKLADGLDQTMIRTVKDICF